MKKLSLFTFLVILSTIIPLSTGTALASQGQVQSSSLDVSLINQNPDAARPGEPVELTFSVQNVGINDLEDISIEVDPEYPFLKLSGESLTKQITFLNARQDDDDAVTIKFKLMTDADAAEGTYDIDVITTATSDSGSSSSKTITNKKTIHLEVRGKEYAQVVTISKSSIDVGVEEPLEFNITNTGSSPIKNMVVSWEDPDGVVLPVYSDNTKYIDYLEPDESVTISYTVMADVNADPGLYTLNVNLTFEDYDSNTSTIKTTAGIFVGGETDFDVSFSESDAGEISLSVANVGNNEAYSVKVSIPEQDNFKTTGSSSSIVGNLEKGDYTIASFDVMSTQAGSNSEKDTSDNGGMEKVSDGADNASAMGPSESSIPTLEVQIEYTDAMGRRLKVNKEVKVEMTSSSMAEGMGPGGRSSKGGLSSYISYAVILLVAGAGVILYRRKKQGKNLKFFKGKKGKKSSKSSVSSESPRSSENSGSPESLEKQEQKQEE